MKIFLVFNKKDTIKWTIQIQTFLIEINVKV